jgi:Zn-dependent peptidase ImmA (M78 family)
MTFDPWAYAGDTYPDWVIRFDHLHGIPEIMCWRRRVILLEREHGRDRRRCSLTHAIGHIELEHRGGEFDTKSEAAANRWAAKMLIDLEVLADVLAWNGWRINEATATDLKVDLETLINRVERHHLHPAELAYLRRRRSQMEDAA